MTKKDATASARRPKRPRRALHAESLLRIPLVTATFSHPTLRIRARGLDHRWKYARFVERSISGFLPLGDTVFYAARSRTADWLRQSEQSARSWNEGDHLVSEVMFCVHDFLHAWALAAVRDLAPDTEIKPGASARDLEELAFLHLATEAAATVGLDYWYLSTVEPELVCDIGTTSLPLTTRYHERHLAEYRRFRPDLVVQEPRFLIELAQFYATGELEGFAAADLARSPLLSRWLRHELGYSEKQRLYIREWLGFLAGTPDFSTAKARPVRCDARWQRTLLRALADRLWQYVKHGVDVTASRRRASRSPASRAKHPFDPWFVNIQSMPLDDVLTAASTITDPQRLEVLCDQLICTFDFDAFEANMTPALLRALEARDVPALVAVLRQGPRVPPAPDEPRLLFFPG